MSRNRAVVLASFVFLAVAAVAPAAGGPAVPGSGDSRGSERTDRVVPEPGAPATTPAQPVPEDELR